MHFHDSQNQLLTISKDRHVCLWDATKIECVQYLTDFKFPGSTYTVSAFNGTNLYVAEKKLRILKMQIDERIELESMQTKAMLD